MLDQSGGIYAELYTIEAGEAGEELCGLEEENSNIKFHFTFSFNLVIRPIYLYLKNTN